MRHDYGTGRNGVLIADPDKEGAVSWGEEEGSYCLVKNRLIRILYFIAGFCFAHKEREIVHLLTVICYEVDSCRSLISTAPHLFLN